MTWQPSLLLCPLLFPSSVFLGNSCRKHCCNISRKSEDSVCHFKNHIRSTDFPRGNISAIYEDAIARIRDSYEYFFLLIFGLLSNASFALQWPHILPCIQALEQGLGGVVLRAQDVEAVVDLKVISF